MPPKVKSINGFSLFVEQVIKRDLERRAHGRSISMQEAINHGDPIWKALPPEQREEWKQRAKTHKISPEFQVEKQQQKERYYRQREQLSDPMATRMNKKSKSKTNAVRIDELERMSCRYYDDVDEENFRQKRERDRNDMETYFLWKAPQDEIERRKWMQERCFHVLSAAAYCETREHEFPPSEMSVVSFSFAEGVTNTKHWLIDHGVSEWTDPDAYEAAQRNELSTGIPAEGMRSALVSQYDMTNDYDNILKTLVQKFEGDKHVFVHRRDWNTVMGCIHWLKERRRNQRSPPHVGPGSVDYLSEERFACIEDLFLAVTKFLDFEVTSTVIADADEQLDKQWDVYMKSAHVLCTFHYSRVGRYPDQALRCSLACARRYTFSMFEMVNDKNYFDDLQIGPNHFPVVATANGRSEEENATGGATASGAQTGAYGFGVRPIGFNMPSLPLPPDGGQTFDNGLISEEEDDDDSLDTELDNELDENYRVPTVINKISFGDEDDDFPPTAPPSRSSASRPMVQPSTSTPVVLPRSVNEYGDRRPLPAPQPSRDSQFVPPFSNGNAFSNGNVDRSLVHAQTALTNVQLSTNAASIASGSGYTSSVETQPPRPKLKPKTLPPSLLNRISSAPRPSASTVDTPASAMSQLGPSGDPSQRLAPRGLGRGLVPTDDDVSKFF